MVDPINSQNIRPPTIFVNKEGDKLGSLLFDIDTLFKNTDTGDQIRKTIEDALREIKDQCDKFEDIKALHNNLNKLLEEKNVSIDKITKFNKDVGKVLSEINKKMSKLSEDKKEDTKEYREFGQKYDLASTLKQLNYYLLREQLKVSSKNILPLSESGAKKYPEKHSLFASTVQETSSYGSLSEFLAAEIKKGGSIENALLRVEQNYTKVKGKDAQFGVPEIATHRLSNHSTKDKEKIPFEVLFVTGSVSDRDKKDKFTKGEEILAKAIKDEYGVKSHILHEPTIQSLEEKLKELSAKIQKQGGKLYIIYNGHGSADDFQDGVLLKNRDKQGAKKFVFGLNKDQELDEDKIKQLYNKYCSDIEVISIFDACESGAAVTAIENKRLDLFA